MNFDLPIEQLVRRTDTRFQLGFATEAKERISAGEAFALSASRRGLHVLAPQRGQSRGAGGSIARHVWTEPGGGTAHRPIDRRRSSTGADHARQNQLSKPAIRKR